MKTFLTRPGRCAWDVLPRWVPIVLNCGKPSRPGCTCCDQHCADLTRMGFAPHGDVEPGVVL